MKPSQILKYLEGKWIIEREIIQKDQTIKAKGTAIFTPIENGLEYSEEIDLDTNIQSSQNYTYKLEDGNLCKYFKDGRLFYVLGEDLRAKHKCKDDLYEAEYFFNSNIFTLTYRVSGPKKAFKILNKYYQN